MNILVTVLNKSNCQAKKRYMRLIHMPYARPLNSGRLEVTTKLEFLPFDKASFRPYYWFYSRLFARLSYLCTAPCHSILHYDRVSFFFF